jgi:chromosome segregation ATPase
MQQVPTRLSFSRSWQKPPNLAQRNHERFKRLQQERQAVEAEEAHTQNQKRVLDEHLETMGTELKEQESKNEELSDRIEKAK